ncbi:MAG: YciI family protein [Ornithinimicrobium sp.]|jgi:hypothetical protein|uniref:YciI family protein n=1 Tax=Ornithinimicrobium sp. TaxID=1977084 RepID=UPI003D9B14CA
MRYVILLAGEPGAWDDFSATQQEWYVETHRAFEVFVNEHGRRVSNAALADPGTATTLRGAWDSAEVSVTDGPFAETAEAIGGYYDVELPDLDVALTAARILTPGYAVEVRPVVQIEGYESA